MTITNSDRRRPGRVHRAAMLPTTLPLFVFAVVAVFGATAGCRGEVLLHEPDFVEPQSTCGNGVLDWREVCDGVDLAGESCGTLGQGDGVLACGDSCTRFDISSCTGPQPGCGNNLREGTEACDGIDVGAATCLDFGWAGGVLGCAADCNGFDETGCFATPCPDLELGSGLGVIAAGSTTGGGDELAGSCGGGDGADLAFGWTAPTGGRYRLDTIGSSINTVLYVLDGSCAGAELGCNDDGAGVQSVLDIDLTAGQYVVIVVDGYGLAAGEYVLNLTRADCGDDVAGTGELCDGTDLRGATCEVLGLRSGELGCDADCLDFDTSACLDPGVGDCCTATPGIGDCSDPLIAACVCAVNTSCCTSQWDEGCVSKVQTLGCGDCGIGPICGDGIVEGTELCDGADLGGVDCSDLGFAAGLLACDPTCMGYDTSACIDPPSCCTPTPGVPGCPDPLVQDCVCQDDAFCCGVEWDAVCVDEIEQFGCGVCNAQPVCGDGIAEALEICDGSDLRGTLCIHLGFTGGTLACDLDCGGFDVAGCVGPGICGNGVADGTEFCDGADLRGVTCADFGFLGGVLACALDCFGFDTSACFNVNTCGDAVIQANEACDGINLGGIDCAALGFNGGTLSCQADCLAFDTSGCTAAQQGDCCAATSASGCTDTPIQDCVCAFDAFCCDVAWDAVCVDHVAGQGCGVCAGTCGNNVTEPPEWCDGTDLGGLSCSDLGMYTGGILACMPDCLGFDVSWCIFDNTCGDGFALPPVEMCDGSDLLGATCSSLGLGSGTLACTFDCMYDTTGCAATGLCCTATPGAPGCGDPAIESCVCAQDNFCCQVAWDGLCVQEVDQFGCGTCGAAVCGNGTAEGTEMCDGTDLRGFTCVDLGFATGLLACDPSCTAFDTSACSGGPGQCGNGIADGLEFCDGNDLRGVTCVDLGFAGGVLACSPDCFGHVTTGCVAGPVCGDGVAEPGEICDGGDLLGVDCQMLGFVGGSLGCMIDCSGFDTSQCSDQDQGDCCYETPGVPGCTDTLIEACVCGSDSFCCFTAWDAACVSQVESLGCGTCGSGPMCGDGVAEGTELCDGGDLRGLDCTILGFTGGTLGCDVGCSAFDASACTGGTAVCGNGVAEDMELCDGSDLRFITCQLLGYGGGGVLVCDPGCYGFDTGGCIGSGPVCGDNVAEGMEMCDGTDVRGLTCQFLGFGSGTLACEPGCGAFDTTGCSGGGPTCGDGVAEGIEMCDGFDLRGMTCQLIGFTGGILACDPLCNFDTFGCVNNPQVCGNGVAEPPEECDGLDLLGMTCADFGLPGGSLVCTPFCTVDTSGCTVVSTCPDVDLGSAVGQVATGSTIGLANQRGGTCVGGSAPDVTFLWDAPYAASWTFDTVGSTYDTGLYLLNGSCTGPELACNDDTSGLQSQVTVDLIAGQTVIVVVDGWGSNSGSYVLSITEDTPTCGNWIIESPEVCDGNNLGGMTCELLGFTGGFLACGPLCAFDTSGCTNNPEVCGNGIAEGTEMCDGFDLRGMTCTDFGMPNGNLVCTPLCSFDTSGCVVVSTCPDVDLGSATGQVATGSTTGLANQRGGSCVGGNAPDVTFLWDAPYAASWIFHTVGSTYDTGLYLLNGSCTGPELACNDDTIGLQSQVAVDLITGQTVIVVVDGWASSSGSYFLTIDEAAPICGDGTIDTPEVCDGNNLGGMTCQSFGFASGSLACLPTCLDFDLSGCGNSSSDCCATNASPGCSDPDIQACVCAVDNYCCQTQWDDICVSEVSQLGCGSCTGLPDNCCISTPGVAGCNDAAIETCVCATDIYCCDTQWDGRCVRDVETFSCGLCTTP